MFGIDTYGSVLKKYHETGELDPNEIYPYITEGIGEDILPENVDFSVIDHFEKVTDKDGAVYTRRLAKEEGIFAGYSAGSAIKGVIQMKDKFKKGDIVIILLHDHGSRYVGKVYNDEWMKQRGWLDAEPTAKSIVETKNIKEFITVDASMTLSEAFAKMKEFDISQMPVQDKNEVVGSLTEKDLLSALLENITKDVKVKEIMSLPFEKIHINEKVSAISKKINKTNSAVIVEDIAGMMHVITEYDLIDAIAG